ncbi:MAG: hypothetical protein A2Z88_08195 [Omnitrophica WOR_2 bacterium GWA2_47_8]|nr:MAG: hypothetical protein A2Z88_08195 [Omnitrophica WOR_2 bacterium GWA2_47_8]
MPKQTNFQAEWEKVRKQLDKLSQEAIVLAKKGEKEVVRISKKGKLQLDSANQNIQKEKLYYLIGKEYVKSQCPGEPTGRLKELLSQLEATETEIKKLDGRIKEI